MPDVTTILGGLAFLVAGCVVGWLLRSSRSRAEKAAINVGWREQFDAQATEGKRVEHQNRSLMRQVSELQLRLRSRGDDEQQRDESLGGEASPDNAKPAAAEERDDVHDNELARKRVERLKSELRKWQERVPPLVERFRQRDADAKRLESELTEARAMISRYEQQPRFDETRAGAYPPGDPDTGEAASNDMLAAEPLDSLRIIKGIGPATARRLAKLGFNQLVDLLNASDEELARVEEEVKGAKGKTEDWQRQAAELLSADSDQ